MKEPLVALQQTLAAKGRPVPEDQALKKIGGPLPTIMVGWLEGGSVFQLAKDYGVMGYSHDELWVEVYIQGSTIVALRELKAAGLKQAQGSRASGKPFVHGRAPMDKLIVIAELDLVTYIHPPTAPMTGTSTLN